MTNIAVLEKLTTFVGKLTELFPDARVELHPLPSGNVMLDVVRRGRLFVLHYFPKNGFGVDEVQDGDGFLTGYNFVSQDFDDAARELLVRLREAREEP
jgi:hypothetical protein